MFVVIFSIILKLKLNANSCGLAHIYGTVRTAFAAAARVSAEQAEVLRQREHFAQRPEGGSNLA